MKHLLLVLSVLALQQTASAQISDCLGFPSASKFTCNYTSLIGQTTSIVVDIPAGFGCNQPPMTGRILSQHGNITMYQPTATFRQKNGELVTVVQYLQNFSDDEPVTLICTDKVDIQSGSDVQEQWI